jgi:predicted site-specific integrase-resolvase
MDQVSEIVGRPVTTLKDWRRKGRGPRSAIVEGRVMYRQSDVYQWVSDVTAPEKASV